MWKDPVCFLLCQSWGREGKGIVEMMEMDVVVQGGRFGEAWPEILPQAVLRYIFLKKILPAAGPRCSVGSRCFLVYIYTDREPAVGVSFLV